ncbi:MAG: TPM domain-containing protein [Verrucomicrobiota bacterium]
MNTNAPVPAGDPGNEVIEEAIRAAEAKTSGEIRVFVSRHPCADPGKAARQEFVRLEMNRTPLRNGVLLYFAPESQAFALACDEGIQFRCGPEFEDAVTAVAVTRLKEGNLADALVGAIQSAGDLLAQPFPRHSLDRDDLPNTVIRD